MATRYVCKTCGNYPLVSGTSAECQICQDERQYVGILGSGKQEWTTLAEMRQTGGYKNVFKEIAGSGGKIHSIHTVPSFGIGHRALLVLTPDGAIIFDTLTFIDSETISRIRELVSGTKLTAIVMSHPHFYNSMSIWAREVGDSGTRLLVHEADRKWVPQDDLQSVEFWSGDRLPLFGKPAAKGPNGLVPHGAEAVHVGGHFEGSTVLLAQPLNSTPPFLLASDSFLPNLRKAGITAMYSFPNFVPLAPSAVLKAYKAIDPFEFEVVLGAFPGRDLVKGGKEKIRRSVEGLLRHMESEARL